MCRRSSVLLCSLLATSLLAGCAWSSGSGSSSASPSADARDSSGLPGPVRAVLDEYVRILSTSRSLDECAARFVSIAGGPLVNEDGRSLRSTVPRFSLKKDFSNLRFYQQPPRVTRVEVRQGREMGFGASALRGTEYQIWIAKAEGQPGMPAPVRVLLPDGGAPPRVVGIGSL